MNKKEILSKMETFTDDQEVTFNDLGFEAPKITLDGFKELMKTNKEIAAYYQSSLDSSVSRGINTWKENNLQKEIDKAIAAQSNEGKSEAEIKLEELTKEMEQMKKESLRKDMSANYTKVLSEKKLPVELIDFVLADTNEATEANIEKISTIFNSSMDNHVKSKLGDYTYTPQREDRSGRIEWSDVVADPSLLSKYQSQKNG